MMIFEPQDLVESFRNRRFNEIESRDKVPESISICTVCMNRLSDLQQTLPKNLEESRSYPKVEFVLLDYGSQDGLRDWVASLQDSRLKYFRVETNRFRPCHSRNVAMRLSTGRIVTNVDADNYIHSGFLEDLNRCFYRPKTVAIPSCFLKIPGRLLLKGRFAFYRKDFLELGGLDEDLDEGWGFDDLSLIFRAVIANYSVARFDEKYLADRIETSNERRILNMARGVDFEELKSKNRTITTKKIIRGITKVNPDVTWGSAVAKNLAGEVYDLRLPSGCIPT